MRAQTDSRKQCYWFYENLKHVGEIRLEHAIFGTPNRAFFCLYLLRYPVVEASVSFTLRSVVVAERSDASPLVPLILLRLGSTEASYEIMLGSRSVLLFLIKKINL